MEYIKKLNCINATEVKIIGKIFTQNQMQMRKYSEDEAVMNVAYWGLE
jgi:hypothetical protein